jgi:hypothetical protein
MGHADPTMTLRYAREKKTLEKQALDLVPSPKKTAKKSRNFVENI